jgi:hypothetical protein
MNDKITIEHNTTTGEIVEREMTPAELEAQAVMQAQAEADRQAQEEAKAALDALKASARAKLVAGTPLTTEEAATLVI